MAAFAWHDLPRPQRLIVIGMVVLGVLCVAGTIANTIVNVRQDQRDADTLSCMFRIQSALTGGQPEVRDALEAKDAAERQQDAMQTALIIAQATGNVGVVVLQDLEAARDAYKSALTRYKNMLARYPPPASTAAACPRPAPSSLP